jgi:hypothetical protein
LYIAWLQTSYCISLAGLLEGIIGSFDPAPGPALALLKKLDAAFASLVTGKNVETGQPLPGFEQGSPVTMTEKVRIKSIADASRIVAAKYLGDMSDDEEEGPQMTEEEADQFGIIPTLTRTHTRIGNVYDKTITALGSQLATGPIGLVSDD